MNDRLKAIKDRYFNPTVDGSTIYVNSTVKDDIEWLIEHLELVRKQRDEVNKQSYEWRDKLIKAEKRIAELEAEVERLIRNRELVNKKYFSN